MRRIAIVVAFCACSSETKNAAPKDKVVEPAPTKLAGVWPDKFECSSITTVEALGPILGGTARQIDNPAPVPRGVAHPCVYEVATGQSTDAGVAINTVWTYDFDCRDNYKRTADALFEEYKKRNADLVAEFDRQADAGLMKPNDAGIGLSNSWHRPGESSEVQVGAKALDHHGQGLLFIDDDAPCYVRVVGPDANGRLELAKMIAKNLTIMNAPMQPRRPQ
jgi:hypothetical protein